MYRDGRESIADHPPTLEILGDNPVRLWGITNAERIRRLARAAGVRIDAPRAGDARLIVDSGFAFDPAWFRHVAARPGTVLRQGGRIVIAHLPPGVTADDPAIATIDQDRRPALYDKALRKRAVPFVEPLTETMRPEIERRSYYGAYKGVTDLLTKWLWPEIAFALTGVAARAGISPNGVTTVGAILCVVATALFAFGWYWAGIGCGFVFMVLDTVDGKLARCTVTSSKWGNVFDHGIDLVHPPFWWIAWGLGTAYTAHPLTGHDFALTMIAILGGYVAQRLIEGAFTRMADGMHIHVWRRFDTRFRLVTARRNPNMVILFLSLAAGRPDLGLIGVAWWTVASLAVHAVQFAQALAARRRGPLRSWLEEEPA